MIPPPRAETRRPAAVMVAGLVGVVRTVSRFPTGRAPPALAESSDRAGPRPGRRGGGRGEEGFRGEEGTASGCTSGPSGPEPERQMSIKRI